MNRYRRCVHLCLALLLAASFGCASTRTTEGTGEYIDDTAISAKVQAAIIQEPSLSFSEINVETFKGVVQLSGFVSQRSEIGIAVKVAGRVAGVRAVRNDMRVRGQQ